MSDHDYTAEAMLRSEVEALRSEMLRLLRVSDAARSALDLAEPRRHGAWIPSSALDAMRRAMETP